MRERQRLTSRLRRQLTALQRIPLARRTDENADERQAAVASMLQDIEDGRPLFANAPIVPTNNSAMFDGNLIRKEDSTSK